MKIKIKVPVKPYIRRYLLNQFGSETIAITPNNPCVFTSKVYDLLTRPSRFCQYQLGEDYTDHIYFILNDKTQQIVGIDLSEDKIYSFNHFIDLMIKERLFILLDTLQMYQKIKIKSVINNYIDHNDMFESGLTYEALKKAYYRYRLRCNSSMAKPGWHIPQDNLVPKKVRKIA